MMLAHQTQPCPVSCVVTCVAIITGWPVEAVKKRFHVRYRETDLTLGGIFRELNIPFTNFQTADSPSIGDLDGVILVGVPSLNIQGGMHQIVINMYQESMEWSVYDPNEGMEGKLFYSAVPNDPEIPNRVMLGGGYAVDLCIDRAELLKWRETHTNLWAPPKAD